MSQSSSLAGGRRTRQQTHFILIIDDNVQLRSLLARHIMLNCSSQQRSCAIYNLGERSEPRLTYFHQIEENSAVDPNNIQADFTVLEAGSPRHALTWLKDSGLERLTIISDVMMPVDTEVGLPGLISGLHDLRLAVNLVFVSSESQSKQLVQNLMNKQQVFFLIKGSETWNRLPEALVQGAERFHYELLPMAAGGTSASELNVKITRSPYSADLNSRRFVASPAVAQSAPALTSNTPVQLRPSMANPALSGSPSTSSRREVLVQTSEVARPQSVGWWSRFMTWLRGN